jgi:predicted hydrocarbon binding protein
MVFHYDPKKKFFLVSLELENKPGALGNLANLLGIRGINMLEGYFGANTTESTGPISFFVETNNTRLDDKWLKEFIETSVGVENVQVKESVEGFLADSLNFPIVWNTGDRAVMMRMDYLRVVFEALRKAIGADGDRIIYNQGFDYGKASWANLLATFTPRSHGGLEEVLQIYSAVGWGRVSLREVDQRNKHATIRMTESFECAESGQGIPASQFVRGHIAGAMSAYFRSDVKAVETKCVSAGAGYCEFDLSP